MNTFRHGLDAIHFVAKGKSWGKAPSVFFREHDDREEVWGVNNMFYNHRNLDRSFLLHDARQEVLFSDRDFLERVNGIDHPIYTSEVHESLGPMNRRFPVEEVVAAHPIIYYTNVVCWMLALAVMLEPKKVFLHGVDMKIAVEYDNERGGTEHWVGVAMGRGINVHIPKFSNICKTSSEWGICYGYIPKRKNNGLILDAVPDFRGFNKPGILKDYTLITTEELAEYDYLKTLYGKCTH